MFQTIALHINMRIMAYVYLDYTFFVSRKSVE